jgi:hypothetical protein
MQLMPTAKSAQRTGSMISANIEGGFIPNCYWEGIRVTLSCRTAYNAGIKAVEKHGGITAIYGDSRLCRRVLGYYQTYRGDSLQVMQ